MGLWRLQQRVAAELEAEIALSDADRLQAAGKLPEAMWAIRRAEPLRNAGLLNEEMARRVQERQADLEMLDRLENIRLQQAACKENKFDFAGADPAYELAFQDYGIDVLKLAPEEAGKRMNAKRIRVELAVALQDWARICRYSRLKEDTTGKALLAIARTADPDEWRNQVRDALERMDQGALAELARSDQTTKLSPASVISLVAALWETGASKEAVGLLRKTHQKYPGDFWINFELAFTLARMQPPHLEESLRFYTGAIALRPNSVGVHVNLGVVLADKKQWDEAIADDRTAI
jgi:hypothetical protein